MTNAEFFKQAKFGMFIHWGLYSLPAGEWKGKRTEFPGEWVMAYNKIPDREKDLAAVCRARTEKAISDGIDKVYSDHVADYKSLFDRVELKLGGEESDLTTDRRIAEFDPENPDTYFLKV